MRSRRSATSHSFLAGVLGGVLAVAIGLAVALATGGLGSSTKTTTVIVQSPAALPVARASSTSAQAVYERDAPGVVYVSANGVSEAQSTAEYLKGEDNQGGGAATGSGFEVDGAGTILTNWHVVAGAASVTVGFAHGRSVEAKVVGGSAAKDTAVLRVPTAGLTLHPLSLGRAGDERVGAPVLAIGNPFGLDRTLTTGVISAVGRSIRAPSGVTIDGALQTDAPINPGNSGGPLLDESGRVIGITSQIETASSQGGSVGIAFAIPIEAAQQVLASVASR